MRKAGKTCAIANCGDSVYVNDGGHASGDDGTYFILWYMMMKSAEELIASAGAMSLAISKNCKDIDELTAYIEFFGLMRHNLDLIRHRRIAERNRPKPTPPRPVIKPIIKRGFPTLHPKPPAKPR